MYLKVCTSGTLDEITTIDIGDPDNGGATRELFQSSSEQETLNMTRRKDVIGSKFMYKLRYSFMPTTTLESLLTYLAGNYDFYFQATRWIQSASFVQVFPSISGDSSSAGVNYLSCELQLIEAVKR